MFTFMGSGGAWFCPPLSRQPLTPAGVKKSFFVPRFPPAPSPPRGVKGSLNSQFGFFGPDGGVGAGGCGVGLLAQMDKRCGRSQWIGTWFGCTSERVCARARCAQMRVQGERSERAHAAPLAIGRAEQRSGARIRLGACLSEASLRPTPGGASSARYPEGGTARNRPSDGDCGGTD